MVRARHRNSLDVEELLTPGDVVELRIRMGPTACRFEPGHRIRLEITSSDFPNHDRNHNTGKNDLADHRADRGDQRRASLGRPSFAARTPRVRGVAASLLKRVLYLGEETIRVPSYIVDDQPDCCRRDFSHYQSHEKRTGTSVQLRPSIFQQQ